MAASTFTYADQDDLRRVIPQYGNYTGKVRLTGWTTLTTNKYSLAGVGLNLTNGIVFFNGAEGTKVAAVIDLDTDTEWTYDANTDILAIYSLSDPDDDIIIEAGDDKETFINQQLINASMQLSSMLDARFTVPIPKSFQYSNVPATDTAEYDYLIIRATCLLCANNLLITAQNFELAEMYFKQVTNELNTGIVDKINAGEFKLNFERTQSSREGEVVEVTKVGSMSIVETNGQYAGSGYDRIQLLCSTAGAYGTAEVTPKISDGTQLFGQSLDPVVVSGGLDYIGQGLYVRFEGAAMNENDRFDIEVNGRDAALTNTPIKNVRLRRK